MGKRRGRRLAVGGRHEGELLEEVEDVGEVAGVFGEFFEVGVTGVGVVEGGGEVVASCGSRLSTSIRSASGWFVAVIDAPLQ